MYPGNISFVRYYSLDMDLMLTDLLMIDSLYKGGLRTEDFQIRIQQERKNFQFTPKLLEHVKFH